MVLFSLHCLLHDSSLGFMLSPVNIRLWQFSTSNLCFHPALTYSSLFVKCVLLMHGDFRDDFCLHLLQCGPQTRKQSTQMASISTNSLWSKLSDPVVQSTLSSTLVAVFTQAAIYVWFAELCKQARLQEKTCHVSVCDEWKCILVFLLSYTHICGTAHQAVILWFCSSFKEGANNHTDTLWDAVHES